MLFDEITSALDPELVGEVVRVLEALAAGGMTMILVTHETGFARRAADTVVFVHRGRIWEQAQTSRGEPYCLMNDLGREPVPAVADSLHPLRLPGHQRDCKPVAAGQSERLRFSPRLGRRADLA